MSSPSIRRRAIQTLADLIDAARAKPGQVTAGVNGPATSQQIGFEMLKRAAGVDLAYIPFQGGAPAVNALLGQHVESIYSSYPSASEQIRAGKLRALAVGSRERIEPMPNLPTVAESGYKDYEEDVWFGVVAPARTPQPALSQLATWFSTAVQAPEVKSKLASQELYPVGSCGADFAAHLRKEHEKIRPHRSRGQHQGAMTGRTIPAGGHCCVAPKCFISRRTDISLRPAAPP